MWSYGVWFIECFKQSFYPTVADITKEVIPNFLAKPPLKFNGSLAKLGLTS